MRCPTLIAVPLALFVSLVCAEEDATQELQGFAPAGVERQLAYEQKLVERVSPESLRSLHELLSDVPHPAGSEGDLIVIDELAQLFASYGLAVETHWIDVLLARPESASVRITGPEQLELRVDEPAIEGDAWSGDHRLDIGWNAYSASGVAEGEVVYVNRGTLRDFQRLEELGVSCEGKIVIARYGGNFRGYKAKYAQEAGAAGLIIFTDPADSGYVKGLVYPEGGWANEHHIQRGSIKTLEYVGDPQTPGAPSTVGREVERLPEHEIALPEIPVQPIGWASAQEILSRMTGDAVPNGWQGGLPFAYRVQGGPELRVRVEVDQPRSVMRTANVVGTLVGSEFPDEEIVVGCHHDAWGFGAGDPNAGLQCLVECARVFAELAGEGLRPKRTIRFAGWGAEEYGIIGSTEWVEEHKQRLQEKCIAYINLDMAAMGPNFRASAAPTLKRLVIDASMVVPQARQADASVYEYWLARAGREATSPRVGNLGGGSDHVPFYCHIGIPSLSLGGSGSSGVSYHSNYDDLAWYRKIVGDDYEPAAMISRVACVCMARLANADVLPIDLAGYANDVPAHAGAIRTMLDGPIRDDKAWAELNEACFEFGAFASQFDALVGELAAAPGAGDARLRINDALRLVERGWTLDFGLGDEPTQSFYASRYVSPDPTSGYSAWMLPQLRAAVEAGDEQAIRAALDAYAQRVRKLQDAMDRVAVKAGYPALGGSE